MLTSGMINCEPDRSTVSPFLGTKLAVVSCVANRLFATENWPELFFMGGRVFKIRISAP